MEEKLQNRYFPMKLPTSVEGRLVDEDTGRQIARMIGPTIFDDRESLGLFTIPWPRRHRAEQLEKVHHRSNPIWVVMYDARELPVGWFYGYMEDEICFFMDTIALVKHVRQQGIYTAFLRKILAYLSALGYERFATSHHPNNRGVMIAELKVGFNIVGLELHESHGPLIKMVYFMHDDRRESFQNGFRMAPEPITGAD